MKIWPSQCKLQFKQLQISPKKVPDFKGICAGLICNCLTLHNLLPPARNWKGILIKLMLKDRAIKLFKKQKLQKETWKKSLKKAPKSTCKLSLISLVSIGLLFPCIIIHLYHRKLACDISKIGSWSTVGCVQTDATLLTNNSQHGCWMLHVASVCTHA